MLRYVALLVCCVLFGCRAPNVPPRDAEQKRQTVVVWTGPQGRVGVFYHNISVEGAERLHRIKSPDTNIVLVEACDPPIPRVPE